MTYSTTGVNRYGGLTLMPTSEKFLPLAEKVKKYLEIVDDRKKVVKYFSPADIVLPKYGKRINGEPYIRLGSKHICDHDVYMISGGPGTPEMLTELMFAELYAAGRHASRITLICGYLNLSRSDKDEGEEELALLPHIIHLIDSAAYNELHRIIACDMHSPQSVMASRRPALITKVSMARHLLTKVMNDALKMFPKEKIVLSLPDEGAAKRFEWAIQKISSEIEYDMPIIFGQKRRQSSTQSEIINFLGETNKLSDSLVIAFDDEIATGSTQLQTAKLLKEKFNIKQYWATAVHGVFCGNSIETFSDKNCSIDKVYTTDTIPYEYRKKEITGLYKNKKLKVISWAKDLAQIISHHHWGHNIRIFR